MKRKMTLGFTLIAIALAGAIYYIYIYSYNTGGAGRANGRVAITVGGATFQAEIASTAAARARGLSGRDGLGEGEGMLFLFGAPGAYGFWMKDMKFSIDIVWIKDDRVVGFAERVEPEPGKTIFTLTAYAPPEPVNRVLELNAGEVKKFNIRIGDLVRF